MSNNNEATSWPWNSFFHVDGVDYDWNESNAVDLTDTVYTAPNILDSGLNSSEAELCVPSRSFDPSKHRFTPAQLYYVYQNTIWRPKALYALVKDLWPSQKVPHNIEHSLSLLGQPPPPSEVTTSQQLRRLPPGMGGGRIAILTQAGLDDFEAVFGERWDFESFREALFENAREMLEPRMCNEWLVAIWSLPCEVKGLTPWCRCPVCRV